MLVVFFFSFFFSAGQEKPKPKKAIDLFDDDDEDGDIFSAKYSVPTPAQSKKEGVEEQVKYPEKKVNINRNLRLKMMAHSINNCTNDIFSLGVFLFLFFLWSIDEFLC